MRTSRPTCPRVVAAVCLGTADTSVPTYMQSCKDGALVHTTDEFAAKRWPTKHALEAWLQIQPDATLAALSRQEFGLVEMFLDVDAPRPIAYGMGRPALMEGAAAHAACEVTVGPVS